MPIKSIEKQLNEAGAMGGLPRLGTLRKGGEKGDNRPGKDLDYLRLTLEPQYEDLVRGPFESLFGDKPQIMRGVHIAADSADKGFQYWYENWAHAKLLSRCDGETVVTSFNEANQRYDHTPYACTCDPLNRTCGHSGRMDILIPDLFKLTGLWGKFTLLTTSFYDCLALAKSMRLAGVFMNRMPDVAFWSVPFVIGRSEQTINVTINNKRAEKHLSLLFATVDPEFNKRVMSPMLTQQTQFLLAGVNPETGEASDGLPDIEFAQTRNWDWDYVVAETSHLFNHETHAANTISKMIDNGEITDDMDDFGVISAIQINRSNREAEKVAQNTPQSNAKGGNSSATEQQVQSQAHWATDAKTVKTFLSKADKALGLKVPDVVQALRWVDPTLQGVNTFRGTKEEAWAACIAFKCKYIPGNVTEFLPSAEDAEMRNRILTMIENIDIPF